MPERAIDAFRIPLSDNAKSIVAEVSNRLQNYELYFKLRKRARKPNDQRNFELAVTAIICDAIFAYLEDPETWIFLGLSHRNLAKKTRYTFSPFGKSLSHIIRIMSSGEMNFIQFRLGEQAFPLGEGDKILNRRTTFRAAGLLPRWIKDKHITADQIGRSDEEELIILKKAKEWHGDKGEWIEYEDTDFTNENRQALRDFNAFLQTVDFAFPPNPNADLSDRRLKRIFSNSSFEEGGRIFGGFWQSMQKEERREIIINGERVVELDFGQTAIRLLYGHSKGVVPEGDLYAIPNYAESRDGVKMLINAALFSARQLERMPRGGKALFPKNAKFKEAMGAISAYHHEIAPAFFTGIGMKLMALEATIMMSIIRETMNAKIVALPIHDAVLTPVGTSMIVADMMQFHFRDISGTEGVVNFKG